MSTIIEQIEEEIAKLETKTVKENTGSIISVADGVAKIDGLSEVMYNEMIEFPGNIYGIALKGMGDDASLASAGLVMGIVGGALMPPLQARLIDAGSIIGNIPSVKTSFLLPLVCFFVISVYGFRSHYRYKA